MYKYTELYGATYKKLQIFAKCIIWTVYIYVKSRNLFMVMPINFVLHAMFLQYY